MKNAAKRKYTREHRQAFLRVEKQLLGKNSIRGYLHDMDKLFMYLFLEVKKVQVLHRKYARHHLIAGRKKSKADYIEAIVDWECARLTKPDKPLNARETLNKFYSEYKDEIEPILEELGL